MKKHPEYMILIAVLGALVASIIASAVSCSIVTGAATNLANNATPGYNSIIEEIEGGNDPGNLLDELLGGGNGNGGNNGNDGGDQGSDSGLNGGYTEEDVPAVMEIETPELTDDLQACINGEYRVFTGDDGTYVASDLTKDDVAKPELKNGRVLSKVSGKVTLTAEDGKSETMDYTSYYYAEDPTASKITWYIYAYELGSYSLFPEGFENASGDPMHIRSLIEGEGSALSGLLERDGTHESTMA